VVDSFDTSPGVDPEGAGMGVRPMYSNWKIYSDWNNFVK
jgi:hypothetical protein